MHQSFNSIYRKCLTVLASAAFAVSVASPALADDTEIFFGQSATSSVNNPNILLILDSSGSMSNSVTGDPLGRDRLKVVQDVAIDLISNLSNVNVGIMRYDYDDRKSSGSDIVSEGGMITHAVKPLSSHTSSLITEINAIKHVGYTPLQETYYEAALYFMGKQRYYGKWSREGFYNSGNWDSSYLPSHPDSRDGEIYKSPMVGSCQKNHIVYLSDGAPTRDSNGTTHIGNLINQTVTYPLHTKTSCVNDHGSTSGMCLDELADFLYQNDFSTLPGKQNVTSHFIGFNTSLDIFEDAAALGGGVYKTASNAADLTIVLQKIFTQVVDTSDGFTAPAVTVNTFDRTSHLDQLYFTVFKPSDTARWSGNLKKYRFQSADNEDGLVIIGQDNSVAVNPLTGFFFDGRGLDGSLDPSVPTSHSYWSQVPDGAEVTSGGAAEQLEYGMGGARIVTNAGGFTSNQSLSGQFLDDNQDFKSLMSSITISNSDYTPAEWALWAAGVDVADYDEDGNTDEARAEIGAPLHGKPAVVTYGGSATNPDVTLYFGTNDGVLHAINGSTGQEHFAFMPKELWDIVPELAENKPITGNLPYGVDGHITVRKNDDNGDSQITAGGNDSVFLYFGLRRGGNTYYAMDVTDRSNPKMKWAFPTTGQSWSKPVVARVNMGTDANPSPRDVVFVSGGYDTSQDNATSYQDDSVGNSIHMLDADTGVEIWSAGGGAGHDLQVLDMKSSIPSEVRPLDMNRDGFADRIYVNDIAGRLFRFDIHHDGQSHRVTAGEIASLGGGHNSGTSNNRRFYYAPDIALGVENGTQFLTITLSSGLRASPLSGQHNDALFGVRDYAPFTKLGTEPSTAAQDYLAYDANIDNMHSLLSGSSIPAGSKGWYRMLAGSAEKSLAASRIFQNKAYFTTYTPGAAPSTNPCAPALGSGKLIVIDLTTGSEEETILKKPGIPPEVTFLFGKPDLPPEITDTCFGSHCTGPTDPDPNGDPYEEADGGRPVQCLAGPEGCDADADERPERTFWRQRDGG